ncbi:Cytoplasmic dynein 2 light intermediate chain 1 [Holothuria leucospilota]|uniref:Cytoplasmic dynein 2 light intermediate chain 1 n=1 Tax=Holothuria leucospilota TaxID=206669 RepID=A0A9Q1HHJ1_HOLLE|nr:Cytoplasmic dynein 2 light intermediate chain 1 [Holothuria leucospilota]
MPRLEKSIWDIAVFEAQQQDIASTSQTAEEEASLEGAENNVLILGSKDAGKTSLILRFLEKEERPKATIALEYTFGRRAKGHNMPKVIKELTTAYLLYQHKVMNLSSIRPMCIQVSNYLVLTI